MSHRLRLEDIQSLRGAPLTDDRAKSRATVGLHHQLGRLVSASACERKDPGSNPAADMVDAARNTAWDLEKEREKKREGASEKNGGKKKREKEKKEEKEDNERKKKKRKKEKKRKRKINRKKRKKRKNKTNKNREGNGKNGKKQKKEKRKKKE
ncbi:hypothetical protein FHG87_022816 [Trinorchestia longiramus]|nr:hypothetical protein FHG87_022816 [Trinorchestia longiramus]